MSPLFGRSRRPKTPAPLGFSGQTGDGVRAFIPDGWQMKETWTLLAPYGQANIIVSSEPLDRGIDTKRYAGTQGDLLRREFPNYREVALNTIGLVHGPAIVRDFEWVPPDGVPVHQRQLYFARDSRGYTATATSPTSSFPRFAGTVEHVFATLELGFPDSVETGPVGTKTG